MVQQAPAERSKHGEKTPVSLGLQIGLDCVLMIWVISFLNQRPV